MGNTLFGIDFSDVPSVRNDRLLISLAFLVGTLLTGVFNNFPAQRDNAMVFIVLLIVWAFVFFDEMLSARGNSQLDLIGLGRQPLNAMLVGFAMFVPIIVFGFYGRSSIIPLINQSIAADNVFGFVYVVLLAPFVEALFFRGLLIPELALILRKFAGFDSVVSGLLGVLGSAAMFAWYHWYVFGGNSTNLTFTFIFGIIAGLGVYATRSIAFEFGFHGANNLMAFVGV